MRRKALVFAVMVLTAGWLLAATAAAEEAMVGSVDLEAVLDAAPDVDMDQVAEAADELGYDYVIWDARLEVFEDDEAFEVLDVMGEDVTEAVEAAEVVDDITAGIIRVIAPGSLRVGVINLQEILEVDSAIELPDIDSIGSELGYDHVVWDARLEVYLDDETHEVQDVMEVNIAEVVDAVEEMDEITEEIVAELQK